MKKDPAASTTRVEGGPEAGPGSDAETEAFVIFSVDTYGYALPVRNVRHVLSLPPLTRIPTDAAHVLGVFHHQGKVLALWDLHTLFGADGPPPVRPAVLVIEDGTRAVGLLVEHVDEVVTLLEPEVVPAGEIVLPPHVQEAVLGWLRAAEPDEDADADIEGVQGRGPEAPVPLSAILDAVGRPDRGAAVLALHAPVHLLDPVRLWSVGSGEPAPADPAMEVTDGRS